MAGIFRGALKAKGENYMRFGVNYIPSKEWLYSWLDFDEASVRKDIETIKSLGFDHIRAHIIWSFFQPNEKYVSVHCKNNLKKFTKICEEVGMDFFLSLFTGWMSGMVFLPPWLNVGGFDCWKVGMFTNERAIKAEKLLIDEVGAVVAKSKVFLGFDLGNELNCLTRYEIDKDIDKEKVDNWSHIMFEKCNEVAPGKLHNNGMAHAPWFGDSFFTRETLANDGAITPIHAWAPFTGTTSRYGITGKETHRLPNYMIEMAKAYSNDNNRLYQVQEFGMADQWFEKEEDLKIFIDKTLENCASDKNIWGVTWWCSHDISDRFAGFVDFEHNLGVIDVNNKPKAAGLIFKEFIESCKNTEIKEIKPTKALVIKQGPGDENDYTNAERYMKLVEKGIYPAFVTPEKAGDKEYLMSRGIEEIIEDM